MRVLQPGIISTDIIRTDGIMIDFMHWKELWGQGFSLFSRIIITEEQVQLFTSRITEGLIMFRDML